MVDGVEPFRSDPKYNEAFEFAGNFSRRLESLDWIARKRPDAFGPALLLFARGRRSLVRAIPELLPSRAWATLARVPLADHLRGSLGVGWDPLPLVDSWERFLYVAIDDIVAAMWFLRIGLTIPAALVVRTLLERWSENVAFHWEITPQPGESDEDFFSRAWSVYAARGVPDHVGRWWAWLSELIHGRVTTDVFGEEASLGLSPDVNEVIVLHQQIARIAELVLSQIRGGLSGVLDGGDQNPNFQALQAEIHMQSLDEPFPLSDACVELHYYEAFRMSSEQWVQLASIYRELVATDDRELDRIIDPVMTVESFLERRGRATERARLAFKSEAEISGEDFKPGIMMARLFRYETIRETARLTACRLSSAQQLAIETAAQAQEGAARMWLEDSDYSVGCLRILLEQTARLRTHRLKASRAARMEEIRVLPPSRWVQAAGWGRLAALTRAVNEFAHLRSRSRRNGARQLLEIIQPETIPETARGDILEQLSFMFAFEVHALLVPLSSEAARQFTESVTLQNEDEYAAELERFLRSAHEHRGHDFGERDRQPPATA